MKIGYVTPYYFPNVGGVETHVEQLATRMAGRQNEVEILTQRTDPDSPETEQRDNLTIRRFNVLIPSKHYAMSASLFSYLMRHNNEYDIIHTHAYHCLPSLYGALTGAPRLIFTPHYHGTGHSPFRRLLHFPYRRVGAVIFGRANKVICVSEAEAALVRRHFPNISDRIHVIPNGVDFTKVNEAQPYPETRTIVLSAGRLETYKNVDRTIRAMQYLDDQFALRITGAGPAQPELESLTNQLGLQNRVTFLGRIDVDSLYRWFRTTRVYVNMSSNEAMPITPLELMVAGADVVASDIPAHREIAETIGKGSMTTLPLDVEPEILAQTIKSSAAHNQQNHVHENNVVSWDQVVTQTFSIYERMLDAKSS